MRFLLFICSMIDGFSRRIGGMIIWFIMAATLISAGNAIARKLFHVGSNAFLEVQWYLFAATFMLGGGYAFLMNSHVRVDVLATRLSPKIRNMIDIIGIVFFVIPMCYFMIKFSWPIVLDSIISGEMSSNSGGLVRWPVYIVLPLGFGLLAVQSLSEILKRIAFMLGFTEDPLDVKAQSEDSP